MKKLILTPILLIFFSSVVLASYMEFQGGTIQDQGSETYNSATFNTKSVSGYTALIHLDKGWNLVSGGVNDYFDEYMLPDSGLKLADISAIHTFFPISKQYAPLYPNNDANKKIIDSLIQGLSQEEKGLEPTKFTAQWIYAKKAGTLKIKGYIYYNIIAIFNGWNLISINPFLENKKLTDFSGNCNNLSIYEFKNNQWVKWNMNKIISKTDIGKGLAIKSSSNCVMYESESISAPPSLPN